MTLDICNYTNVKLCDEYGINKRFEFLFYNVCNLLLNGANSNYILPIASDDTLGGIKVGDGLIITSDGVLSVIPNYLSIPKFGIEDNLGIQDREVDMETFSFEMFSIDPDFNSYSAFLLDGSSSSFTASDSNTLGGVDAMINGSIMFSIIGDDENRFEVLDSGIRAIQIIGNNTYIQTFAKGNGFIPLSVNGIFADEFGEITVPISSLNFQEVTDNGSITTNGITVDSIDIISLLSLNGDSGTAGQILTSQGGGLPTWEDLPTIGLDDVLGVGNASLNKNIVLGESTEDSMAIIDTNNPNKYILPTRVTTAQRLRMGSKLRVEIESGLGGSGYITPPQITLPACPAWGVQATATAILTAGVVTSLVMPNEGRGYKIPPGNAIVNNTGTGGTGLSVLYFSTTDPITPGAIVYDTDLKAYFYYDDNDNWRMMSTYSEAAVYWSSLPDPTYYQVGSETLLVLTDLTGAASSVELDLSSQEIPGRKITFLNLNNYLVSGRSYIPQPSSKYVRLSGGMIDAVPSLKVSSIVYSGELDKWIQVIEY